MLKEIKNELIELQNKSEKLENFLTEERKLKNKTTEEERHLLGMQLVFMKAYMEILEQRMALKEEE